MSAPKPLHLEITPAEAASLRARDHMILVDVREPWEVATASISGALLMPMGEVAARAHTELDPDAPIVVVCHHGMRSLSVASWLRNEGFAQAQSMAGGIEQWSREVDPSVPRY